MKNYKLALIVFVSLILFHSNPSYSKQTIQTKVYDLYEPDSTNANYQVLSLIDGLVYELNSDSASVATIKKAFSDKLTIELTVNEDSLVIEEAKVLKSKANSALSQSLNQLESVFSDQKEEDDNNDRLPIQNPDLTFPTTRVSTMQEATNLYESLTQRLSRRSQCYQRAHVWAHHLFTRYNVYSMKVFLFFSKKYIREYRYKWWFHVSPYIYVNDAEVTLDYTFTETPLEMKNWTDVFIYSKKACPSVARYPEYELKNANGSADCYLLKVPMYYYQPMHIEERDVEGAYLTHFRSIDIEHSRKALR